MGADEVCTKCGKKKPRFGYLIQCVWCKIFYCKECANAFTKLKRHQKHIDSCPKCEKS